MTAPRTRIRTGWGSTTGGRIGPWVGRITAVDERTCILETGADNLEMFAGYLGFLGAGFSVTEPPELVDAVRELAARYGAAVPAPS